MVKFYTEDYPSKQDAKFQTWANNLNYVRDTILPQLRSYDDSQVSLKRLADDLGLTFRNLARVARKYPKYLKVSQVQKDGSEIFISIHDDLL